MASPASKKPGKGAAKKPGQKYRPLPVPGKGGRNGTPITPLPGDRKGIPMRPLPIDDKIIRTMPITEGQLKQIKKMYGVNKKK